ncbi:MAG: hypothetical protein KF889_28190 [Alphaproteobacteria bacterium]|nr:hypothetical protein [Alphaproteobacteria bacterium]MCW5743836.1 hypothetical protein [Alphaproteobacteria bacterium]
MSKTMIAAFAIALVGSTGAALADGNPELDRSFGAPRVYSAPPSVAVVPGPVASDADARARLQADGYRAIDVTRGNDGAWHGTAIRGAARLGVTVDPQGRIYAR